jgi:hypothetical protein
MKQLTILIFSLIALLSNQSCNKSAPSDVIVKRSSPVSDTENKPTALQPIDEFVPDVTSYDNTSGLSKKSQIPGETVPLSKNRTDLIDFARKSLNKNSLNEAISFADVLLLMNPKDLEAMEIRGIAQNKKGDKEAGNADLDACCKSGRISCCHKKK